MLLEGGRSMGYMRDSNQNCKNALAIWRALAHRWSGARVVTTRGFGHSRLLREPSVVDEGVAFLTGRSARQVEVLAEQALHVG